jgi:SAM-dependent methyltransferase
MDLGLLTAIAPIAGLRCIVCCSLDLDAARGFVLCRACGQEYPILGGVPVMFESVSVVKGEPVDASAARDILAAFDLADDALSVLRMRHLMRQRVRFGNALIQVESQQFVDRVHNTGHAPRAGEPVAPDTGRDLATPPRIRWTKTYLPRRMPAGGEITANARLENRGEATLYARGRGLAKVVVRWQHPNGEPAEAVDLRTELPIDVRPGQAVTIAVRIAPPAQAGRYLLTLCIVQEQIRWLDEDALTLPVSVVPALEEQVPEGWVVLPDPPADYDADHTHGRALLAEWLQAHAPPQPRVLEIGGNAVPMVSLLGLPLGPGLVNVDVDLLGLQVAALRDTEDAAADKGNQMRHVCADAFDLPFPSAYFDAIVVFASLHHFPDPAALLDHLRRKLKPGGFIGLFCEPVGHIWPGAIDSAFLAELERGINEQSFSLREYELMFDRAELAAVEVLVNKDSLKARLVHAPSAGD